MKKTVRISRNYSFPNLLRQTSNQSGVFGDYFFTEESLPSDYLVILNAPPKDIKGDFLSGGTLLISQEPPYEKNNYYQSYFKFADTIISKFKNKKLKNHLTDVQPGLPWHINKSFDELLNLSPGPKLKNLSWITSNLAIHEGHIKRLEFLEFLKQHNFEFDLYGRGFKEIEDKFEALYPYKFSIAIENYFSNDYFTEKLIDCILSYCIPFYYGCKNLNKYFPKGSYLSLDLENKNSSMLEMKEKINSNFWEENIENIKEARHLILYKYQLFPLIIETIEKRMEIKNQKKHYSIPYDGLNNLERWKQKFNLLLKK